MGSATPSREAQIRRNQIQWGEQLRDLAQIIEYMADALLEDDEIAGIFSGEGIANHLPALPKHIRDVFMEYLSDEAAAAYKADQRYFDWDARRAAAQPGPVNQEQR